MEDRNLLATYAATGSDEVFTELVNRHLGLVYSTALRRTREARAAEEITQLVFTLLARKAPKLSPKVILAGWLYKTARHLAAQYQRTEQRRLKREKEAAMMQCDLVSDPDSEAVWALLEPLLDDAMHDLPQKDRTAILLRFFQRKRLREVGLALGLREEAARKRVDRALDRLRDWFNSRGLGCTTSALAAIVSARAGQGSPVLTPSAISAVALKAASACTGGFLLPQLGSIVLAMKLKSILITTGILLLGTLLLIQRQKHHESSREAVSVAPPVLASPPAESPTWRRFDSLWAALRTESAADDSLRAALARLRAALYAPAEEGAPADNPARDILGAIPLQQRAAALEMVIEALRDSDKHVCNRAVGLVPLIWPEGEAAIPVLFELVRTRTGEWPEVASPALIAAVQARPEPAIIPELVAAAIHGPAAARRTLAVELPVLKSFIPGSETAFAANLKPYLYSLDQEERFTAARALAQFPGPKDPALVSELLSALNPLPDGTAPAAESIRASLEGLRTMGPEGAAAVPAVLRFADENPEWAGIANIALKALAPEDLKGIGVPTPLPPLSPAAATLADRIEEGTLTPAALSAAMQNPETALTAARALAEFGPGAAEALPAVRHAFGSAVQTNLSVALVLGGVIERLNPGVPKPLLLPFEVLPALGAVQAEARRWNRPDWNQALETLPARAPLGIAFLHDDLRRIAEELGRIDPALKNAFIAKLLDADHKFGVIFHSNERPSATGR